MKREGPTTLHVIEQYPQAYPSEPPAELVQTQTIPIKGREKMMLDQVEEDLQSGISWQDCLRRLASYIDAWIAGQRHAKQMFEVRIARLESVVQADKQLLDEVDKTLRQTWDDLDKRVLGLEAQHRVS